MSASELLTLIWSPRMTLRGGAPPMLAKWIAPDLFYIVLYFKHEVRHFTFTEKPDIVIQGLKTCYANANLAGDFDSFIMPPNILLFPKMIMIRAISNRKLCRFPFFRPTLTITPHDNLLPSVVFQFGQISP